VTEPSLVLGETPRDVGMKAASMLCDRPREFPNQRSFKLLESAIPDAAKHTDLMQGIVLAAGGTARRPARGIDPGPAHQEEIRRQLREKRNLLAIGEIIATAKPAEAQAHFARMGPLLAKLPDEAGASAVSALAHKYIRAGQWNLAREAYLLMADRYPAHP